MAPRKEWPLWVYLLVGLVAGVSYVAFDVLSEAKLSAGTLTGALANAHSVVDHLSPVLAGMLIGLSVYQLRLRARLSAADEAASRAEALRLRLLKVERDQAVWVLAAAILHELNNPLQALGLLLDEYQACAPEDEDQRVDLAQRAQAHIQRALSHLETLRSMQTNGEPEEQSIKLDRLIATLATDVNSLAQAEGIVVRANCKEQVVVNADPGYLRTILENLLDNSLHSLRTSGGGTVTIHLATECGRAVVRVVDDGPPLQASIMGVLFDPLRTTKRHGLGLGLPIARALARAMDGELSLGEGLQKSFRLELPLGGNA